MYYMLSFVLTLLHDFDLQSTWNQWKMTFTKKTWNIFQIIRPA